MGKLLGVLALLAIATALMSASSWRCSTPSAVGDRAGRPPDAGGRAGGLASPEIKAAAFSGSLLPAIIIIYLKAALCASLTLLISTFASSMIFTIIVSVIVYFIGHVQGIAREYWMAEGAGPMAKVFLSFVALLFPDLQLFNLVDDIVVGTIVPMAMFWKTAGLGVIYILVYLFVGYFIFAGKEL